jgi:hypothetical protein
MNQKFYRIAKDFFEYCNKTNQARVYKFTVSARDLKNLFDYDTSFHWETGITAQMSALINRYIEIPQETKDQFFKGGIGFWDCDKDSDLYTIYRLYKIMWLAKDIRKNGQKMPLQIIQAGRNYHTHPGSDKKFAITYLTPLQHIDCFYIWYPLTDPDPWIWTINNKEVKTAEQFVEMFEHREDDSFVLEMDDIRFTEDGFHLNNNHFDPWAEGIDLGLRKYGNKRAGLDMTLKTVSYRDAVHRHHMDLDPNLKDLIRHDGDRFYLDDFIFDMKHGRWQPQHIGNLPKSLLDDQFKFDENTAEMFNAVRANIGKGRHYL